MMRFEKRWARALLAAFAPSAAADRGGATESEAAPEDLSRTRKRRRLAPRFGEVDYVSVLVRLMKQSTPQAALGLRAAIWIAALSPLWLWGRIATVTRLAAEHRTQLLGELLRHKSFMVRELALLLKFCAAMALLGNSEVRERSGYDGAATHDSGLRARLPVLDAPSVVRVWPANDGVPQEVSIESPQAEASEKTRGKA